MGIDKVYASNEAAVEHLHKAANHLGEHLVDGETGDLNSATCVGEKCQGNNPFDTITNCVEGRIKLPNGSKRKFRKWIPADGSAKATVLLIHGYGEHSGRYHTVAHYLNEAGYQVISYDHKFHGEDEGNVGHKIKDITTFDDLVNDAVEFCNVVEDKYSDIPYYVLGHSMGGLVALLATLKLQDTWKCKGVVFSSPAVKVCGNILAPNPYNAVSKGMTNRLSKMAPTFPAPGAAAKHLTHVKLVQKMAKDDPLMFGDKVSARFAQKFVLGGSVEAQKRLSEVKAPFLVITGTKDKVCSPKGSRMLADAASSEDKLIKEYEGGFHELFNEDEEMRTKVLSDVASWLDERL